ncbi:hypothetical protein [Paenibacillus puerhi]|uniref:hypothetical protein n=1 Tax=Paenibacillus puerhi TaxID=2692622 RepID=UPI001357FAFA|nr:hypothetical protein [Paenibacillus puerhi]
MKTGIHLLDEWIVNGDKSGAGYSLQKGLRLEYPEPENSAGWYPIGFERGHDGALDAMGWFGLRLGLQLQKETADIRVKARFIDNRSVDAVISLAGAGDHEVKLKLSDFEIEGSKGNIWRLLKSFELQGEAELAFASLQRGDVLYVETNVLGKAGELGEEVVYTMTVHNCTPVKQHVNVKPRIYGWESLHPVIHPAGFVLEADGSREVTVTVKVHDGMVAGGHEETALSFIPNGRSDCAVQAACITLRALPHPYIYHDERKWKETREKIDAYPKFKPGFEAILAAADGWEVRPPVPVGERDYCYDTHEEHNIMSAAYAYALTGELEYAEKVARFLRHFCDEATGYPRKKKGCSQSYVQEGHFFQHLAIPYDIIFNAGVLTTEDHQAVERTFRIYMDILDHHLQQGHISNWLLSEITGAVYCALALQDMERAKRFVFGIGGSIEQLKCGLFSDGWWYECSVGYNTWVSSMYIHTAHALLPFGYNLLHTHFRIPFNDEVNSTYGGADAKVRFGMVNKKWGGRQKGYVCIKDMFDATIPFLDYRGVMFGISDSDERKLEGVHFGSTFDLAYHYYKDPAYIPVIRQNSHADPIFGHGELPEVESAYVSRNAYADNVGIAMLRSQTEGREQKEQIQAVIRYGSHGYAHGHFDRTGLLSLMRYGRSFYNPEHVWWGYGHFMYKFYVQNSMTKNMVVVDEKLQVPSDSRRLLFYSGKSLQAAAIETVSPWSYPPYGGMVYRDGETLEERCRMNASWLPQVPDAPPYGELSDFTEPVRQRRVMAVTDDYVVLFDFVQGEKEHQYDRLFQIKGFQGLKGESVRYIRHTSQWTENSLSDAQFITDCSWYEASGSSVASFVTVFGEEEGEDMRGNRTAHNEPGLLKLDVHTAWPQEAAHVIGRAAEYHGYTIPLSYRVETDGEIRAQGEFGAWLLGEGKVDIALDGVRTLTLRVTNHPIYNEQKYPQRTKQGLFWGEAYLLTADGTRLELSNLALDYENIDPGHGIGRDYEGGRVTIVGNEYARAIPTSPADHEREGIIRLDVSELGAVRFVGLIGADAFPGDEAQRRMTYGVRTRGRTGRFTTVVEPFESESRIAAVTATDADTVEVRLKDGRTQTLTVLRMEEDDVSVKLVESRDGCVVSEEETSR